MSHFISFLKANKKSICIIVTLILTIKVAIIDQLTKDAVLEYFDSANAPLEVLPMLNIVKIYNKGISFGFLGDIAYGNIILTAIALAIICCLWIWFLRNITIFNVLPIGFITGGAIGNLIDRAIHEGVVDFIDFHWGNWHYPAFNIADSAIVLGVIILALRTLTTDE